MAAHADATDCIFFEGALTDKPGGVVRVEAIDIGAVMNDLEHVVPGYYVGGIEPLFFAEEAAIEAAIEDGEISESEWTMMSKQEQHELLEELREEFRHRHNIQFKVDYAMRLELVAVEPPRSTTF